MILIISACNGVKMLKWVDIFLPTTSARLSSAGIVFKRMDMSLTIWYGYHSSFFRAPVPLQNSNGYPLSRGVKYTG